MMEADGRRDERTTQGPSAPGGGTVVPAGSGPLPPSGGGPLPPSGGGPLPPSPSRRLLSRLRDVMAGAGTAQERLDKIVRLIATEMVAEVCSCYVMRPGEVLELFATIGLNPEAVHNTRLRVSEGLVGEIAATARPLAIDNAPSHPKFAYRPETGEDPYQALVGVPILRSGRVRGVLVIQNQKRRRYSEEEVETLQTIAMVVAEMIGTTDERDGGGLSREATGGALPTRLDGVTVNGGVGKGLAVLHRPQLTVRQLVADDPVAEMRRFREAVDRMHSSIDELVAATDHHESAESRDILETYRMFAQDRGWLERITEAIGSGLTAEAAVARVQNDTAARMAHVTDPYLRERLQDFEDLANRLLLHLSGRLSWVHGTLPDETVLIARAIGPAELLDYDRSKLRGLVLEDASTTSHVSIIARALNIPVLGGCQDVLAEVEPLDLVIVDADHGQLFVRPAEDVEEAYQRNVESRARRQRAYDELRELPARTVDGIDVSLQINAGLVADMPQLDATGTDGVGLYRTEIPFMVRARYPDIELQAEIYRRILDEAGARPVTFRTLDVGGDKRLPYFEDRDEENPALGWRALRIGLDRPSMLRGQVRALLRAADGRPLRIMLPMVSEVDELDRARTLIDMELDRLDQQGLARPRSLEVGAMLEVPSLLWQLPLLLARVDFLAVGSNDLAQYLFAADRGDPRIGQRYDPLSPPMLNLLDRLQEEAAAVGVPVSVCGEMAGRPLDAIVLVALGFRLLSMAATSVGPVKAAIRCCDAALLARLVHRLRIGSDHSLRPKLAAFCRDHDIPI